MFLVHIIDMYRQAISNIAPITAKKRTKYIMSNPLIINSAPFPQALLIALFAY